jgi:hypothetical protein
MRLKLLILLSFYFSLINGIVFTSELKGKHEHQMFRIHRTEFDRILMPDDHIIQHKFVYLFQNVKVMKFFDALLILF